MRWSIVRLIWLRELRDQLRDRRTVFMIVALPLLLYPLLGTLGIAVAWRFLERPSVIGVVRPAPGSSDFPAPPTDVDASPFPACAWLTLGMPSATLPERMLGTLALAEASAQTFRPPLLIRDGAFAEAYLPRATDKGQLGLTSQNMQLVLLDKLDPEALQSKQVDLLVTAPADFWKRLEQNKPGLIELQTRDDDLSRQAAQRLRAVLGRWGDDLRTQRLRSHGLTPQFLDTLNIRDSTGKSLSVQAQDSMAQMLVRLFPFMLVMWALGGALYPAVDLCAGEKERGTMETLLISPALREEIVAGKFLTIWVFSAGTALANLISMGFSTWQFSEQLPQGGITLAALFWCVVLIVPLSAFFSAISLAVGVYARSSKEGQYYLMPLFLLTMPLIFLTLAPGVELNQLYSMVPVTGVALLMQRLMLAPSLAEVPWFYFVPVFGTVILYSWLALRWAIVQFQREEVLFREAERLDIGLWLRRLFAEKEATPSVGMAVACFGVLLLLRWLTLNLGEDLPPLVRTTIITMAFMAAPPLLMAVLLTARPDLTIGFTWPRRSYLAIALLLLPLAALIHYTAAQYPAISRVLRDRHSLVVEAWSHLGANVSDVFWGSYLLLLGVLPAAAKELAFRGFILSGLRHRLLPWSAILLSSFFFAVYHTNVFALAPMFVLGVVTGMLTLRSGSILPGVVLHTGCNIILLGGPFIPGTQIPLAELPTSVVLPYLLPLVFVSVLAVLLLLRRLRPGGAAM